MPRALAYAGCSVPPQTVRSGVAVPKNSSMAEAYLVGGVRTPFGRYGGALASVRPDDLAALVVGELVARSPELDPGRIDDVMFGDANQAGEDNRDVARMASLLAGLPTSVPGT